MMAAERAVAGGQARMDTGPFDLLETVVSPMFVHQGGQVLFANAAMERLTGRSRSELAAIPYCQLAHEDDKPALRQFCESRLRGEAGPNSHEFRVAAKEGEIRHVEVKVSRTRLKGQAALIGSIYDFTDRQRAEAAQRSMRRLLRQIIDGDPVPTFVIDADHKLTHWNRACAAITGVPASDIVGTNRQWAPFYPAERPVLADLIVSSAVEEQFETHYQDKLRRSPLIEGAFEGEDFFPHFGDDGCWLYFTAAPLRDDSGRIVGAIETLQDVTARHQAENELRRYQAHLEKLVEQRTAQLEDASRQLAQSEKLASLGQLAAGVAHEINNPIGFVLSNIGSLENYIGRLLTILEAYAAAEPSISAPEQAAKIRKACQEGDVDFLKEDIPLLIQETRDGIMRVKKIVQDLKEFSHVDLAHDWQWTDLHKCLDSTLNIVNSEVKYKADLVKEYGQLPEVECLPWQLNQVFMNLVVNATQAMGEKRGTITIRTGKLGNDVWLEFADDGCGIPEEIRSKVFDPFFTTKPVGKGTGLGLSLSYGIIQSHGGRIELASEVGKGTTFRVVLPIKHVEKLQGKAGDTDEANAGQCANVLAAAPAPSDPGSGRITVSLHRAARGGDAMAFVNWGSKYRIGDERIDQEHRYLFDLINEFHDSHSAGADRHALEKILNRLVHYAEQHFRHEEEIMQKTDYPAYTQHCQLHDELYLTIFRLSEQLGAGSVHVSRETMQFVRGWVVNHILKHDLQFAGYIAGRASRTPSNGK